MTSASRRVPPLFEDSRLDPHLLAIMRENKMWPGAGRKYAEDYEPPPAPKPIALEARRKRETAR